MPTSHSPAGVLAFRYCLKLLSALNAILEAAEQTDLTINQVRLSFNQLPLTFSVATSPSSDSIGSPCNGKKSMQIGQTDYFHTDTFVLLLKFRYKLVAGKFRHLWNVLWTTPINSLDKTIWKKLRRTKAYKPYLSEITIHRILHMHSTSKLPHTTFCSQIPRLYVEFHVFWLVRQCNITADCKDFLRNVICSQIFRSSPLF